MNRITAWIAALTMGLSLTMACSKEKKTEPTASKTASAAVAAAASSVKPGSHEDWCDEHQVPESQCTKCHPELIPAFKATSDWCEEHQMPESQCRKCKPDLKIARPAKGT